MNEAGLTVQQECRDTPASINFEMDLCISIFQLALRLV